MFCQNDKVTYLQPEHARIISGSDQLWACVGGDIGGTNDGLSTCHHLTGCFPSTTPAWSSSGAFSNITEQSGVTSLDTTNYDGIDQAPQKHAI